MSKLKIEMARNNNIQIDNSIQRFVDYVQQESNMHVSDVSLTYNDFFRNKLLLVLSIREGIPHFLFSAIRLQTPFSDIDWANFLNISTKSLQRYKVEKDFVFKPIHSEKIIELAEVTQLGETVFDSQEQFYNWLKRPNQALGNMKPIELLKDSYGKELVVNELTRIDQGIFV
jgi:putative toxin-antitoxin system antitoxin component (TIGR02293 family)